MDFDSKIYVSGHRGLVGSAIMRRLKEKGYTNIITRRSRQLDLRDQGATARFFKKEKPEYVFLAAAKVGGILANDTYRAEFIYDNIMIAANIIHASYTRGVKKLLNLGSSCIYPKFAAQPMKEEYLLTGELEPTNEPYAIAKISAIKLCRYYNEQYGTNFISVMPTNLYGPNDNFDLETSHVLPALIRKFHLGKCLQNNDFVAIRKDLKKYPVRGYDVAQLSNEEITDLFSEVGIKTKNFTPDTQNIKSKNKTASMSSSGLLARRPFGGTGESGKAPDDSLRTPRMTYRVHRNDLISNTVVTLWGTGSPYREFLYVDDLADACVFLMERYGYQETGEFVNIGTGKDGAIKDLAEMVKEIAGFKGDIEWDTTKPDGTPRKLLDISRIKSLGWNPKVSLEEGIRKTFMWYLSGKL